MRTDEQAATIIAGLMQHPEWVSEVPPATADFFGQNRVLMAAWLGVLYCYTKREPVTLEAMREGAKGFGKYLTPEWYAELMGLHVLRSEFMVTHRRLLEEHRRNRIARTLSDALGRIKSGEGSETVLQDALTTLGDLSRGGFRGEPRPLSEHLASHSAMLEERMGGKHAGIATGLVDLDRLLLGMRGGDLIVVAARPGMGKSVFGVHVAMEHTGASLILSMEMQAGQILDRLLANESYLQTIRDGETGYIPIDQLSAGKYDKAMLERLLRAAEKLSTRSVYLDDTGALSIHAIQAKTKAAVIRNKVGLLVVDYLQLAEAEGESRNVEIGNISKGLKALAKELNIPVVALAQLNRSCEARVDKRPVLSDLRESGNIEQDADVVLMLYRDDYYNPDSEVPGTIEVLVRKNRQGRTGSCFCAFHGDRAYLGDSTIRPGKVMTRKPERGFTEVKY